MPRDALNDVGRKYGLKYLMSGVVPVADKQLPHYLSGIAMKIRGAIGVYEATFEDLRIYLLLRNPREGNS